MRPLEAIGLSLLLVSGVGAQTYDPAAFTEGEFMLPALAAELALQPSEVNAWSLARKAFRAVRRAQVEGSREAAALVPTEQTYNESLAPSLRNLRHGIFLVHKLSQSMDLSFMAVKVNARKGRASRPRRSTEKVDLQGPPQPVATEDIETNRVLAGEPAIQGRRALEAALEKLRASPGAEDEKARVAEEAMREAAERALAVARDLEKLCADGGLLDAAIQAQHAYLESANKALKPVPEDRRRAVVAFNRMIREFARLEFELARDGPQARYLHGEIDKLGRL